MTSTKVEEIWAWSIPGRLLMGKALWAFIITMIGL